MDKPWKVVLAFLAVFVAGAVFGGFFSLGIGQRIWKMESPPAPVIIREVEKKTEPQAAVPPKPAPAQQAGQPVISPQGVQHAQILRRLTNQLGLTAKQKNEIAPILDRATQDLWRVEQNRLRDDTFLVQRLKTDIAKELTPEQQTRLDDLWQRNLDQIRKRTLEAQKLAKPNAVTPPPAGTPTPGTVPGAAPTATNNPAPTTGTPPAPPAKPPAATATPPKAIPPSVDNKATPTPPVPVPATNPPAPAPKPSSGGDK